MEPLPFCVIPPDPVSGTLKTKLPGEQKNPCKPLEIAIEPEPEKVVVVTVAPESPEAMPAQVTTLFTVMVRAPMVVVPAANSGKLPVPKATLEELNAEVVLQLAVPVSHVPLVAADVPLLSHHRLVAPA